MITQKILACMRNEGITSKFLFIFLSLIASLFVCYGILALYSYSLPENGSGTFAILFMVGSASYTIGNVLGFLFGIPKTIQSQRDSVSMKKDTTYQVNTSLEQISDWLTKMIVGAGLVEFKNIAAFIRDISKEISSGIGPGNAQPIIISSIICFMILGFFVTYLSTRLYIANALAAANAELQENSEKDTEELA